MERKIHTWSRGERERETRPKTGLGPRASACVLCSLHTCVRVHTDTSAWATRSFFFFFFLFMTLISWVGSLTCAFACLRHDHPSHASGRPLWRQLRGGYSQPESPVDSTTTSFFLFSFPFSSLFFFFFWQFGEFVFIPGVFMPPPLLYVHVCTVSKGNDVLTRRDLSISLKRASFFIFSKKPRWEFVNFVSGDQFVSLLNGHDQIWFFKIFGGLVFALTPDVGFWLSVSFVGLNVGVKSKWTGLAARDRKWWGEIAKSEHERCPPFGMKRRFRHIFN